MFMKKIAALVCLAFASGCATTPSKFYEDPTKVSDAQLCRTIKKDETATNIGFWVDLQKEVSRRGLDMGQCDSLVSNQNALIGAGALLGAIVAVAAASRGGGNSYAPGANDFEWDWDQFYNEYRQLVWACRGVQTGQYAEASRCSGKWQTDNRWPSKSRY